MTGFHILNLKAALGDIALASSISAGGYEDLPAALKTVDTLEKTLGNGGWLDIAHAHKGTRFTDALSTLNLHAEKQSAWLNLLRQRAMCAYGMFMQSILIDSAALAAEGLKRHRDRCLPRESFSHDCTCARNPSGHTWLVRLAIAIHHNLASRRANWELNSAQFLPTLSPSRTYTRALVHRQTRMYDISSDEIIETASEEVVDVLVHWFNAGTYNAAFIRLLFIKSLLQWLGPGALLLDSTWKLFGQSPAWLLPHKARWIVYRGGQLNAATVCITDALLPRYPVGQVASAERHLLGELQGAYNALSQGSNTAVG